MTPEQEALRDSIEDRWGRGWDGHMFLSWMVENREMVVRALYGHEAREGWAPKDWPDNTYGVEVIYPTPSVFSGERPVLVLPCEDAS